MLDAYALGSDEIEKFGGSFLPGALERNISRGLINYCDTKSPLPLAQCYVRALTAKCQGWDLNPALSESSPHARDHHILRRYFVEPDNQSSSPQLCTYQLHLIFMSQFFSSKWK